MRCFHSKFFSYIFWMGDLNFRLEENTFDHEEIVKSVQNGEFSKLLSKDQLTQVRRKEEAFHEFSEKMPTFAPTYKFVIGTENYDTKYEWFLAKYSQNLWIFTLPRNPDFKAKPRSIRENLGYHSWDFYDLETEKLHLETQWGILFPT